MIDRWLFHNQIFIFDILWFAKSHWSYSWTLTPIDLSLEMCQNNQAENINICVPSLLLRNQSDSLEIRNRVLIVKFSGSPSDLSPHPHPLSIISTGISPCSIYYLIPDFVAVPLRFMSALVPFTHSSSQTLSHSFFRYFPIATEDDSFTWII